ncbi:short-chain dehydrogenase/reductase SDR [Hyaloraphidium curvatum]|nr:short-chain dehydrogenase/reductase SDR [Hyaloraphidium curvatum]
MPPALSQRLVNATGPRVALITGGASGIGAATALAFARAGAHVAVSDLPHQAELALKVAEKIKGEVEGAKVVVLEHDVAREDEWERVIEEVHKQLGPLDILVHCAAIAKTKANPENMAVEDFKHTIDINLVGTFLALKWGVRSMKQNKARESKSIITASSVAGIVGFSTFTAYSASKGGTRIMTKSFALHCAGSGYNIRCNSTAAAIVASHPIGRMGRPEEVADVVVFLGSEESSFMTGSEVIVDGGYIAQ